MEKKKLTKVLLIHNQRLIREGLSLLLGTHADLEIVAAVGKTSHAIRCLRIQSQLPEVVLLFVNQLMDLKNALDAITMMLSLRPTLKIIVSLPSVHYPYPWLFLKAGVVGYLSIATIETLLEAIEQVQQKQLYMAPEVLQAIMKNITGEDFHQSFETLSERELEVLQGIAKGQTIPEIAILLGLHEKTASSYRYRLFEKLKVDNPVTLMHIVLLHELLYPVHAHKILNRIRFAWFALS